MKTGVCLWIAFAFCFSIKFDILFDNAFNMKAGIRMLESSLTPCFIHKLQLIIKDSLFSENNISVLIAKSRQTVGHFNHSSTACEKLKKFKITLGS